MGEQRRLAAILAADMVGYSRLMEADEIGTIARQKAIHAEIFDPEIKARDGRIVKTTGDGILAEFPSVVEAVKFATNLQRALAMREEESPREERILYRVGINLGDIIIDGDDILGDGVNIAARLESRALPGGICISRNVFNQVKNRLELGFEELGPIKVKNISEPVVAFRVLLDPEYVGKMIRAKRLPFVQNRLVAGIAATLLVLIVGGIAWWQPWVQNTVPSPSVERDTLQSDTPSIAVLPFTNMSGDPEQTYFADGMTNDLITDLSKISGLFVIARNSVFTYKGKPIDIQTVASELGVRYILEGSVRRAGNAVRINAQLIDSASGGHVWAERYDGSLNDIFGLQDEVARKIVGVLEVRLTSNEQTQLINRGTKNTEAYDKFLKGWDQYLQQTPEGFRQAITHFEKAVDLDPDYSRAYAALAATYWQIQKRFWHTKIGLARAHDARFKSEEFLEKAHRNPTALSHQVATAILSQQGHHSQAIEEGEKAVRIDPNDADSYVALAGAFSLAGEPDKALNLIKKAMRLNPHFPSFYLYELGLAQFGSEDFTRTSITLENSIKLNSQDRWPYRLLLATYGHLDRQDDAKSIFKTLAKNWRGYDPVTITAISFWYPYKNAADRARLTEGLRKAGVPD